MKTPRTGASRAVDVGQDGQGTGIDGVSSRECSPSSLAQPVRRVVVDPGGRLGPGGPTGRRRSPGPYPAGRARLLRRLRPRRSGRRAPAPRHTSRRRRPRHRARIPAGRCRNPGVRPAPLRRPRPGRSGRRGCRSQPCRPPATSRPWAGRLPDGDRRRRAVRRPSLSAVTSARSQVPAPEQKGLAPWRSHPLPPCSALSRVSGDLAAHTPYAASQVGARPASARMATASAWPSTRRPNERSSPATAASAAKRASVSPRPGTGKASCPARARRAKLFAVPPPASRLRAPSVAPRSWPGDSITVLYYPVTPPGHEGCGSTPGPTAHPDLPLRRPPPDRRRARPWPLCGRAHRVREG